jgi:hypothetical protein
MTTKLKISLLFFLGALLSFAQTNEEQDQFKKIKSYKVAFFTEELSLSTDEAANFWPIYNQFEQAQISMWRGMRKRGEELGDKSSLTESQAKNQLEIFIDERTAEHKRTMKLYKDLLEVLPAKKVLLLPRAEENFRRKLMRMHRERRVQSNKDKSNKEDKKIPLL